MEMTPIGRVGSPRTEPLDDDWDSVTATVTLDADRFTPDALDGLAEFSHVEVVYVFDRVDPLGIQTRARHPATTRTGRGSGSSPSAPRAGPTGSGSACAGCSRSRGSP